jgi:hypothetical protein
LGIKAIATVPETAEHKREVLVKIANLVPVPVKQPNVSVSFGKILGEGGKIVERADLGFNDFIVAEV